MTLDLRRNTGEYVMDDQGTIPFDPTAVLVIHRILCGCSAFVFPNGNRKDMPVGFGFIDASIHFGILSSG
jgi:hypothetical protein